MMKRTTCLILALLMVFGMVATMGAASPEPEATAQPAATEQVPAPEEDVPGPAEEPEPVEPVTAGPAEPAAEAAESGTTEPETAPAEEPAEPEATEEPAEEPEATEEPIEEPEVTEEPEPEATEEPVAAPAASNDMTTISESDPQITEVTEQPAPTPDHRTVKLHANGGYFTGDHAGYDGFPKALDGDKLPKTDGEDYPGDPDWYTPERPGYRFLGWYSSMEKANAHTEEALIEGDTVPEDVTDLYAGWEKLPRTVTLDAAPGSFKGDAEAADNYTRTVNLNGDNLPSVLPEAPVYDISKTDGQTVEFTGWYTEKTTVTKTEKDGYWQWDIHANGEQVQAGGLVQEGVTTLYAGYQIKEDAIAKKTVTFYLDWNGIDGLWGPSLSVSRSYSDELSGYKLAAGDLAVRYLNWDGETGDGAPKFETQEQLDDYWQSKDFNGYKFLGWATSPKEQQPNVTAGSTVVKNGQSLYAVWTKGDENSWSFKREVGKLTHLRFLDLKYEAHGMAGASITISPYAFPIGAEMADVVWTFTYGTPNTIYDLAPPVTMTVELKEGEQFDGSNPGYAADRNFGPDAGFKAEAKNGTLVITDLDGMDHAITVSVKAKAVEDGQPTGEYISTPEAAPATAVFFHNWVKDEQGDHLDPTCDAHGYDTYKCTCGKSYEKIIPPLEHTWKSTVTKEATCTEDGVKQDQCTVCQMTFDEYQEWLKHRDKPVVNPPHKTEVIPATGHTFKVVSTAPSSVKGAPLLKEECEVCQTTDEVVRGDITGNGELDIFDVLKLHESVLGRVQLDDNVVGDTNGNGEVNIFDVLKLHEFVLGRTTLN